MADDVTLSTKRELAHVVIAEPEPKPGPSRLDLALSRFVEGFHHCRWPIGEPSTEDFRFCGRRRVAAKGRLSPYCVEHTRMAYHPARRLC
jgi:GcrA cell cycle regulator